MKKNSFLRFGVLFIFVALCFVFTLSYVTAATRPVVTATNFMCTAGRPAATMAGVKIMQAGGNAIDAGVAMMAAIGVTEPEMSGLGGDAFIIIYDAKSKKLTTINACGWAPAKASVDAYIAAGGIPERGPLSTEMPGAFGGWIMALDRYGTKSLGEVLAPAIELAEKGQGVTFITAKDLADKSCVELLTKYPWGQKIYWKNGKPLKLGDLLVNPDYAGTFRTLVTAETKNAHKGRSVGLQAAFDTFYKGEIADRIVKFLNANGNPLFTKEDFAEYKPEELAPITVKYKGIDAYECPPLSQGHVLLQAMNILEGYDLKKMGVNSADYIHVVTEALKLGFADREKFVADPRFVPKIPIKGMLSKEYAAAQRARIDMNKAMHWPIPPGTPEKFGDTTFMAAMDKEGNVFATTTSILSGWGSGMVVDGLGFFLNNRMNYFTLEDGHANQVAPRKRTRQTINPAIALLNGKPYMAWGTPGADQQPQSMLQVFLKYVEFGMTVQDAIESPLIGVRSFPASSGPHTAADDIQIENRIPQVVIDALKARGHKVTVVSEWGVGGNNQMIVRDPVTGVMQAGADPRREGYSIGW